VVICLERVANDFAYGPADATAAPVVSCFIKMQSGFTFSDAGLPRLSWKMPLNGCLSWGIGREVLEG